MKYVVRLREEADRDIADASAWYEEQRESLGHEFLDELLRVSNLIQITPLLAARVSVFTLANQTTMIPIQMIG